MIKQLFAGENEENGANGATETCPVKTLTEKV
jgi:hypothetical protein